MNDEYAKPRDVDTDLAEITSRLGEPDATHRTNRNSVIWRFLVGVLIVLFAAGVHYAMWTGQVPWPGGRRWKLWILILAAMFVGPGVGLYLITFAIRGLKLWVLVYRTGLFVWHRGQVIAFPWDDIRAVQIAGIPDKAVLQQDLNPRQMPNTVWYDLEKSRHRVFGTTITLTRTDGEQVSLFSTLDGFAELGRRVQEETFRRLFPLYWADLQDGSSHHFGAIKCDRDAIHIVKKSLPWPQVESVAKASDKLEVKQRIGGKKKSWAKYDLNEIVNLHVLMGIVQAMRGG